IDLFDASTAHIATGESDAAGYYAASFSAGASTFYVATDADGYVNEIYSGIACISGPAYFGECPFTGATLVPMPYQNTIPRIVNFALQPDAIFGSGFE